MERRYQTLIDIVRLMICFSLFHTFFWGYALETAGYLLNLVPSKSVPLTPMEMWTRRKPSLQHIHIWGCPAHVLKPKVDKLESRSEVCQFVGYPKGTRGYYFYSQVDQKVFVSTNARFLEDDYMVSNNVRSKVDLRDLDKTLTTT